MYNAGQKVAIPIRHITTSGLSMNASERRKKRQNITKNAEIMRLRKHSWQTFIENKG